MSLSVLEQSVIKLIDQSRDDIVALMQKLVQIPRLFGRRKRERGISCQGSNKVQPR